MKKLIGLLIAFRMCLFATAQDLPPAAEQELENTAITEEVDKEDDSYVQLLAGFSNHPLNLNEAERAELEALQLLSALQIDQFLQYRHLFGNFVDKYELQAIPGWDLFTIRRLLPYIIVDGSPSLAEDMRTRFSKGQHSLLLRVSFPMERADEYDHSAPGTKYEGGPEHIFARYNYRYKNLLQFGITADKDAGESFFSGAQKTGFDFYSFHFFMAKKGIIQSLALGDFTVNMGQGLIQWQSMAFKKSSDVTGIKRQLPVIRPYNAAGEFNFHRGTAITLRKGKWEATMFFSLRKLSAGLVYDSITKRSYFPSFQTSGYHRNANEIADKNAIRQTAWGGRVKYQHRRFETEINWVAYKFSANLQKRDEPYNLYAINGDHWFNISAAYSYTFKNMHVFGEAAADPSLHKAFINGLLLSVDPAIDISLLYRNLNPAYQSLNGNAFTENTSPTNEKGWYAGILTRPASGWQVAAYADIYCFPWLRYQVDAPGNGRDFLLQLTYIPNRQVELYTRFKNESKQGNQKDAGSLMNELVFFKKQNWRTQFNYKVTPEIMLRNRVELLWYDRKGIDSQTGFLIYADVLYKPLMKPYSVTARLAYFETTGYDARVYTYENDVLYSYAIPALSGKGYRYYLVFGYNINKTISCWLRWSQIIYVYKDNADPSPDSAGDNRKTELKLQVRWVF